MSIFLSDDLLINGCTTKQTLHIILCALVWPLGFYHRVLEYLEGCGVALLHPCGECILLQV